MELDWVKKKLDLPVEAKRRLVELENEEISIARQCELLGLQRSSFYYRPMGESEALLLHPYRRIILLHHANGDRGSDEVETSQFYRSPG
ncbi:MAG: hypothetical protein HRF42_10210, partial [Candidatus Brocadia sp.]